MSQHFIIVKSLNHMVDCFCPGENHADYITINKGDIIEISDNRKYTIEFGWYVLVIINDYQYFYLAVEALEKYFIEGYFLSLLDIELMINYLQFQIDQSLDSRNQVSFINFASQFNELKILRENLNLYLDNITERQFI